MTSKLCYCANSLKRDGDVWPDSFCSNCYREFNPTKDKEIYTCFDENCIHKECIGDYYSLCLDCYDQGGNDDSKEISDNDNKIKFILNKFTSSLSSIS